MDVTNTFKRLDLVDTVPEELWTDIHNIVQEPVTKANPKEKKKMQEVKVVVKALQIDEKRREAKGKGERERYTQLIT